MKKNSLKKIIVSTVLTALMSLNTLIPAVSAEEYGVDVSRYQGNINWEELFFNKHVRMIVTKQGVLQR